MAGPKYGRLRYDLMQLGMGFQDGDYIKLAYNASTAEDVVIYYGAFTDAADSGFAPGSLALDPAGKVGVCDASGLWQTVTV